MAFEFDLETELPDPIQDNMGADLIEFAIGYDVEANHAIVMSVMLVPVKEGKHRRTRDIRFGIRERDLEHEWKITGPDYSIASVRRYIAKEKRTEVLNLLLESLTTLIAKVKPKSLTMETAIGNLPDAAMKKYGSICSAVKACDFELTDEFCDGTSGKCYWFFKANKAG